MNVINFLHNLDNGQLVDLSLKGDLSGRIRNGLFYDSGEIFIIVLDGEVDLHIPFKNVISITITKDDTITITVEFKSDYLNEVKK